MLHYTDLFRIQQHYWGGDLYSALIFPRTSGRKRPKRIEQHIQFYDSGTRIMRWKIGPRSAQTDRKNVLPVTKYEGWLEISDIVGWGTIRIWMQWNNFHTAYCIKNAHYVCRAYRFAMKNINDVRSANGFRMNHEEKVLELFKEIIRLGNMGYASVLLPWISFYTHHGRYSH